MASVHVLGGQFPLCPASADHLSMLCNHRQDNLGQGSNYGTNRYDPYSLKSAIILGITNRNYFPPSLNLIADRTRNGIADLASRRASSRGIIPKAKVKTVKMTIVIVIVFVLCWSPYIVFDLLQVFGQIPDTQTNIAIATFIQSLAPLNSAANPLIYCLFSTQVCRMIK